MKGTINIVILLKNGSIGPEINQVVYTHNDSPKDCRDK